jgi:plastocyanin
MRIDIRTGPRAPRRIVAALLILAAVTAVGGALAATSARSAADVTITGRDFFWSPSAATINVGDTVTWTNAQGFHNVAVAGERLNNPGFPGDAAWNPPPQKTFTAPGTYTFVCEVHGTMTGTITVQGAGPTPTPTPTPTPEPVPPPGGGIGSDTTPPQLSNVTLEGLTGAVRVRYTVSEPATLNARFTTRDGDVRSFRAQTQAGTWTIERQIASGTYTAELWAVDGWGNRSSTYTSEVTVRG